MISDDIKLTQDSLADALAQAEEDSGQSGDYTVYDLLVKAYDKLIAALQAVTLPS